MEKLSLCYVKEYPNPIFKKCIILRNKLNSFKEFKTTMETEFPEMPTGPGGDFITEPPLGDIIDPTARNIIREQRRNPSEYDLSKGITRLSAIYPKLKENRFVDIEQALHEGFDAVNRRHRHTSISNRFFPSLTDLASGTREARILKDRIFYIVVVLDCSKMKLIDDITSIPRPRDDDFYKK